MDSKIVEIVPCEGFKCVQSLLGKVKDLSDVEKKHLITSPKPTPDLCISHSSKSQAQFCRSAYNIQWIVGCSHLNKLFCWCCIFFSEEKNDWNTTGYDDLNNLRSAIEKHQNSPNHLKSIISFCSFGKETSLSGRSLCDEVSEYNARVDYNRKVFERLVATVCCLAKLELPYTDILELFLDVLSLLGESDPIIQGYLQQQESCSSGPIFSDELPYNILHSIADVLKSYIVCEIKNTNFVSLIVDETPYVNDMQHLCFILRYYSGNNIQDCFLGYVEVSNTLTADALASIILEFLHKYECLPKLVAISFDGISIKPSIKKDVEQEIKGACPQAISVWSYGYTLNSVLSKCCGQFFKAGSLFYTLQAMASFFNINTKTTAIYDRYCNKKLPVISANHWSYSALTVYTVFEEKENLIKLFEDILDNVQGWDCDSISSEDRFYNDLTSFNFNFFLSLFNIIFHKTDNLSHTINESQADIDYCNNKIKEFQLWLHNDLLSQFDQIYEETLENYSEPVLNKNITCAHTEYKRLVVLVIDTISSEINNRYSELYNLQFLQLFNKNLYGMYHAEFPATAFDSLFTLYPEFFERDALKAQLTFLYSSDEFKNLDVFDFIHLINERCLQKSFSEIFKLAQLIVTIPTTKHSAEQRFSPFQQIHAHFKTTLGQERHSDLSMVLLQNEMMEKLKRSPTFYADVIKAFVKNYRIFDLEYK